MTSDRDEPAPADSTRPERSADEPVLPRISRDESEIGWGDEPAERDDEWYLRERPPHHG